jgi:hypothetical protein
VIVATTGVVTDKVVTLKLAELEPEAIVTVPGT